MISRARLLTTLGVLAAFMVAASYPVQADGGPGGGSGGSGGSGGGSGGSGGSGDGSCHAHNNTCTPPSGGDGGNATTSGTSSSNSTQSPTTAGAGSSGGPQPNGSCKPIIIEQPSGPHLTINPLLGYVRIDSKCLLQPISNLSALHFNPKIATLYQRIVERLP